MTDGNNAIIVKSASRHFDKLLAVDDLSFQVHQGEIFGLLGPNGAGKTTTINLITGMLARNGGEIEVEGFDPQIQARQVHKRIGLAPQETNVYLDLNAVDNLKHHAALYCDDLANVRANIESLLRLMNLWERRKDPVRNFSGGMKRRLVLARSLLHKPEIILFDEPTLGVDVQGKYVLWEHIREQQALGKTFVISTNNMAEAETICDRLLIIDHGKAIALDTPEHLKSGLGRDIVTLRTTPAVEDPEQLFSGLGMQFYTRTQPDELRLEVTDAEAIVGELVFHTTTDHRLESIRIARPSLDDVFLHYTGRALRE